MSVIKPKSRKLRVILLLALFAAVSSYAVYYYWPSGGGKDGKKEQDKLFTVKRGDFNVTYIMDGSLSALKQHMLRCEARGRFELKVIEVVEDRKKVKKGDMIVKFKAEDYTKQIDTLKQQLDDARRDLILVKEDVEMKKSDNIKSIKSSRDSYKEAHDALKRYLDHDEPDKRRGMQNAISNAEDDVDVKRRSLSDARNALASGRGGEESVVAQLESAVNKAESELTSAESTLDTANSAYRIYKQYDYPKKTREVREQVERARISMQDVIINARGKLKQFQETIENHEKRISRLESDLAKMQEDVSKLVIRAPVDGYVTLGAPRRHRWDEPKEIKVGTVVSSREVIATIPDLSKFIVNLEMPEEFRSNLKKGLVAKITCPAIPNLTMTGKVTSIAQMGRHSDRWDNSSPKVYDTRISTDSTDPRLRPGMTVKVELVFEKVENALYVPIECVFHREGKKYVRRKTLTGSEAIEVETGRNSLHDVEITKGIAEGDVIFLQNWEKAG